MATSILREDWRITGNLVVEGSFSATTGSLTNAAIASNADIDPTKMGQRVLSVHPIDLTTLRTWDDLSALLPGTAASDDLGFIDGTFGTTSPVVQTSDAKATTVTQRARFLTHLPANYDDGETVNIRVYAGMETTISDGTATIDFEVYESDGETGISADLVTTAATSINSATYANYDFVVNAASLAAGDILDCRVTIAITDSATGTAVLGTFGKLSLLVDTRG
jgi:hypothetical protein